MNIPVEYVPAWQLIWRKWNQPPQRFKPDVPKSLLNPCSHTTTGTSFLHWERRPCIFYLDLPDPSRKSCNHSSGIFPNVNQAWDCCCLIWKQKLYSSSQLLLAKRNQWEKQPMITHSLSVTIAGNSKKATSNLKKNNPSHINPKESPFHSLM